MRLVFIDPMQITYDTKTTETEPLGGTQSAIIYLCMELANQGHEIHLFNFRNDNIFQNNINFWKNSNLDIIKDLNPDVVIVSVSADLLHQLKNVFYIKTKWVLWTGHDINQPANEPLKNPLIRYSVDIYAFVSDWQRNRYINEYCISKEKTILIRNGINPYINPYIKHEKKPILAYTSTPFRGLDKLIEIYPLIKKRFPEIKLKVFSGMNIYQQDNTDEINKIIEKVREMEDTEVYQGISQKELAEQLKEVSILSYPCTFEETSCISVLEAMANDCWIVSSNIGALKETTNGNGFLVEPTENYIKNYIFHLDQLLRFPEMYKDVLVKQKERIINDNLYPVIAERFINDIQKNIERIDVNETLNEGIREYTKGNLWNAVELFVKCEKEMNSFEILKNILVCYKELNIDEKIVEYAYKCLHYDNNNVEIKKLLIVAVCKRI